MWYALVRNGVSLVSRVRRSRQSGLAIRLSLCLETPQSFRLEHEVGEVVVVVELDPPVERDHQIVVAQQMALAQEDVVDLREVGGVIIGNRAESRREDQQ